MGLMHSCSIVWGSIIGLLTFVVLATEAMSADTVVVPNNLVSAEGNENNNYPFNPGVLNVPSLRYQQVFASSDFGILSSPFLISKIAFRPEIVVGIPFSTIISNIQINLSTTRAAPDTLSATFAHNVGDDDMVVHRGQLQLSSAFTGPEDGPKDFDTDFSDLFVRYVFMRLSRPPPMKVLATQGLQSLQNASNASD